MTIFTPIDFKRLGFKQSYFKPSASFLKLILLVLLFLPGAVFAHGVDDNTQLFLSNHQGVNIVAFLYFGAKHMVTGYDHLLFLVGVIFFLFRARDVVIYVSFFTLGHSITLVFGVLYQVNVNAYLIDAIIAFSIIYKAFDNLGGFKHYLGFQPNAKLAVLIFGLFHGFGLATKLLEFDFASVGLIENLIAFNIGVELGQFVALMFILLLISFWRKHHSYLKFATSTNTLLMSGGFMLLGYQLTGYFYY